MRILTRWEPSRGVTTLQDRINRLFNDTLQRVEGEASLSAFLMLCSTAPQLRAASVR